MPTVNIRQTVLLQLLACPSCASHLHGLTVVWLQMERAFTPPLMARMGRGDQPDPHNISDPVMTSFHNASWAATVEQLEAHPLGGLRFTSFR